MAGYTSSCNASFLFKSGYSRVGSGVILLKRMVFSPWSFGAFSTWIISEISQVIWRGLGEAWSLALAWIARSLV